MPGPHASESCCANSGNPCSRQPPRPHQLPPARNLPGALLLRTTLVKQLADFEGEHLLADIGNGTMNLLYLTDSQPQENRCWTEKIGVNQCMIRAKEAVLRRFGSKISDSTVEQVLRTGTAKIDVDYLACIREVAASYVAELFAALRSYEYDPATTHLTIVGDGGQLIKHFGSYDPEQFTIVDDICAPRVNPCRRYGRPICGSTLAKNRSGKRGSICRRWTNQRSSRTAKRLPRQCWIGEKHGQMP